MKYITVEELEDKYIGKVGTPRRDSYEDSLQKEIYACYDMLNR